jgi:uncharacterized iron-regulated membrane protein
MHMTTETVDASPRTNAFYFAAWRWHFYAGLYVAPFLIMLAVTGLIMLWISATTELNGERGTVTATDAPLAVSVQAAAAVAAVPGGVVGQYIAPMGPDRVAIFKVDVGDVSTTAVVDPYTATVTETFPWQDGWYEFANDVHGSLLIGNVGDILIEIAASLGIILVATGVYLWWPRDGARAQLTPDLAAKGRGWWKSMHQVTGIWVAAVMVVFLISGLSWAGVWGEKLVQAWNTFPAEKWDNVPLSDETHASMNHDGAHEVAWTLEQTPMPQSGSLAGSIGVTGPVTFDSVADFANGLGFDRRYQVNFPAGDEGVWTVSHDSMTNDGPAPSADRTIHIDQFTGRVLADVRYADYSVYAKAMAYGIAFHEGDMGAWNMALNTLFCASIIFMSVSGLVLWWKRRPTGVFRLAAPPLPDNAPLWKGAALLMVVLGVMFPLAGGALLGAILLDLAILRNLPGLKRMLS